MGRAVQILRIRSCLDDEVLVELTAAFDDAGGRGASDVVDRVARRAFDS